MPRFMRFLASLALVGLCFGVTGCKKPGRGTANPEDYYPLILVALDGGKTAAMIGRNEFIDKKNFAGCVSTDVLISAFDGAGDVLAGKMTDQIVIPGFELDLEECMALKEDAPEGNEDVAPIIEAVAGVALLTADFYATKLKTANCKKGTAALGAIAYIKGLVEPIAAQVAEPGGSISIPAVTISFAECGD